MRVFLDDERETPVDFERVYSVNSCLYLILNSQEPLAELSLDNDLGVYAHQGGDGFRVAEMLEWYSGCGFSVLPETLRVHTANPVAREKMQNLGSLFLDSSLYPEPAFYAPIAEFRRPDVVAREEGDTLVVDFAAGQDVDGLIAYHLRRGHGVLVDGNQVSL